MISEKYKDFYVSTASKQLKNLADLLVSLEKEAQNRDIVEDVLRLIHSMKGAAATMGYKKTVVLLHSMEDVFSFAYRQKLSMSQNIIDNFFDYIDILKNNLKSIKDNSRENNLTKYSNALNKLLKKEQDNFKKGQKTTDKKSGNMPYSWYTPTEITLSTYNLNTLHNLLDNLLINVIGAKGLAKEMGNTRMLATYMETSRIVSQLKRALEKLRTVSLSEIFSSLPYLVRDIARQENKNVELIIKDNDLSLDKAIIDELVEIVTQLLRNAVTHGISQKQKNGRITVEVSLDNDQLEMSVSDNGQGIDWKKIVAMAVKKRFISVKASKKLSIEEKQELLFAADVSSNKKVDINSGRGIGLGIVKQKVKELDGLIKLESSQSKGTTFTIVLPLPLSIFRSLSFHLGDFRWAIPLSYIEDIIKLEEVQDLSKNKFFSHKKGRYKLILPSKFFTKINFSAMSKYVVLIKSEDKIALPIYSNIRESELVMKKTPYILKNKKYIRGVAISSKGQPVLILDINNLN